MDPVTDSGTKSSYPGECTSLWLRQHNLQPYSVHFAFLGFWDKLSGWEKLTLDESNPEGGHENDNTIDILSLWLVRTAKCAKNFISGWPTFKEIVWRRVHNVLSYENLFPFFANLLRYIKFVILFSFALLGFPCFRRLCVCNFVFCLVGFEISSPYGWIVIFFN